MPTPESIPNLFLVGAPKAGTSALAHFMGQHPEICMSRVKEPNFHNLDMDLPRPKSEKEYRSLFERNNKEKHLCDGSILYLYSRTAAKSIHEYNPEAKILIMLRNPVDATLSWHSQMVYTGNEPERDFDKALELEAIRKKGQCLPSSGMSSMCPAVLYYRDVMSYPEQIERFMGLFRPENIKILIFDDFRKDAQSVYRDVAGFLEIDQSFEPVLREVNPKKERTNPRLHLFLKKYFAEISKQLLPLTLRHRMIRLVDKFTSKEVGPVKMSNQSAEKLKAYYRDEIDSLGNMLNRDLSHWWQ